MNKQINMYTYIDQYISCESVCVHVSRHTWSEVVVQAEDGVSHTGQVNARSSACLSSGLKDSWRERALRSASSCANAPLRSAEAYVSKEPYSRDK